MTPAMSSLLTLVAVTFPGNTNGVFQVASSERLSLTITRLLST
jgi:hypothetical protein